ncbi:MAG: hypothetical protein VKJ06_03240 [Vampirovibrionales bacterium]|nr:hypothetical protein [Vampirovibrionales bacterium]
MRVSNTNFSGLKTSLKGKANQLKALFVLPLLPLGACAGQVSLANNQKNLENTNKHIAIIRAYTPGFGEKPVACTFALRSKPWSPINKDRSNHRDFEKAGIDYKYGDLIAVSEFTRPGELKADAARRFNCPI